jgi:hypothetical protein
MNFRQYYGSLLGSAPCRARHAQTPLNLTTRLSRHYIKVEQKSAEIAFVLMDMSAQLGMQLLRC